MPSYHDTIGTALDQLTVGLRPYLERKLKATFPNNWQQVACGSFRDGRERVSEYGRLDWDAHSLLTVMWDQWNAVFRTHLGHQERSLVSELRTVRNGWAHQHDFDFDDAFRVLDSVRRLLEAIGAPNTVEINRQKQELLESYVAEQVNSQVQRTAFNRGKWWIIGIYSLCCAAISYHAATSGHYGSSAIISFVLLVFVYLIYQQFKMEPPLLYGPRECHRCKRIVYRKQCPYCEPQPAAASMTAAT
ncbi:MAG: Swt1 family HEPN domain-containing protein [Planctomycetaceae bacterium]